MKRFDQNNNKILVFTTNYPHSLDRNPENTTSAIHYFCREWVKLGYEVTVILFDIKLINLRNIKGVFSELKLSETNEGVNLHKINITRLIPKNNYLFSFQNKNTKKKILDIIEGNEFPLIVAHFPVSYLGFLKIFLKNSKSKITFTLHNMDINYLKKKGDKSFVPYIENNNINVLFRSKKIAKLYENLSDKSLENFDDSIVYSGAPEIITGDNQKEKNTFLYVGRLVKNKNVDIILRSLAKLKHIDFKFNIIGIGPEYKRLISLTKYLGIEEKVNFLGKQDRETVIEYMGKAEYFVMVSSSETFGLVYIEALSKGCITIGTKGEGIDGVIKNFENGFLVEAENIDALYNIINIAINMKEDERKVLQKLAKVTAERYSETNVAKQYLEKIQANEVLRDI